MGINRDKRMDFLHSKMSIFFGVDEDLLDRVLDTAFDIFDFVHIWDWNLELDSTKYTITALLSNYCMLSVQIYNDKIDACLFRGLTDVWTGDCSMILNPSIWSDIVGWMSWVRSVFDDSSENNRLYLSIPKMKLDGPWSQAAVRPAIKSLDELTVFNERIGKNIVLPPEVKLETNPRKNSFRIIADHLVAKSSWIDLNLHEKDGQMFSNLSEEIAAGKYEIISKPKSLQQIVDKILNVSETNTTNTKTNPTMDNFGPDFHQKVSLEIKDDIDREILKSFSNISRKSKKVINDPGIDELDDLF